MNKLIKLSYTHYIIVDDSEIKSNEWFYSSQLKQPQIYGHDNIPKERGFKKITHSTQPKLLGSGWMQSVKPLLLSEVEEAINGYNVEKMAEQDRLNCGWDNNTNLPYTSGYIRGFKAHQELVKDKLFTIEQVNSLVNSVIEFLSHNEPSEFDEWYKKKLQKLLPKTEWDVEFDEQGKIKLL